MKSNPTSLTLTFAAKKFLYNSFFPKGSCSLLLKKETISNKYLLNSFKLMLLQQVSSIPIVINSSDFLVRSQVLYVNNAFLHMNIGKKFTLIKPKFKRVVFNIEGKELLFFSYKIFFQSLKILETAKLLHLFQFKSIRLIDFFLCSKLKQPFLNNNFFKKFGFGIYRFSVQFFFFKPFNQVFSRFQKKINFFQFNVFLEKYKYNLRS